MSTVVEVALGWLALSLSVGLAYVLEVRRRRYFGMPSIFSDLRDALDELGRDVPEPAGGCNPRSGRTSDGVSPVAAPRN